MVWAIVVLYNKAVTDSLTLKTLAPYTSRLNVIVYDNSTRDFGNKAACEQMHYTYCGTGKNVGISKAYNCALSYIRKTDDDYAMILDDDTSLTEQYIMEMFEKTDRKSADVILPIVKSNGRIISPTNVRMQYSTKAIHDISEISMDRITGINTGMIVKSSVYKTIQYPEKLFLDFVDHSFMAKVRESKYRIEIMKSEILQSFSRDEKPSVDSVLFRFGIFRKDLWEYCEHNRFYYSGTMFVFLVKNTIKFKTLAFIKKSFERF